MQSKRFLIPLAIILIAVLGGGAFVLLNGANTGVFGSITSLPAIESDPAMQMLNMMLSDDGALAVVDVNGGNAGPDSLRMYDTSTGSMLWEKFDRDNQYMDNSVLGFLDNGASIARTGVDDENENLRFVRVYDARSGETQQEITLAENERALAVSSEALIVYNSSVLSIRNRETGEDIFTHDFGFADMEMARFTQDGQQMRLIVGGNGYKIYTIDMASPAVSDENMVHITDLPVWDISKTEFSGSYRWIGVSIINGQGVAAVDLQAGRTHHYIPNSSLTSETGDTVRLDAGDAFFRNEQFLAYLTSEGTIYAVDLNTNTQVGSFDPGTQHAPERLAISGDGRVMAVLEYDRLLAWRLPEPPAT